MTQKPTYKELQDLLAQIDAELKRRWGHHGALSGALPVISESFTRGDIDKLDRRQLVNHVLKEMNSEAMTWEVLRQVRDAVESLLGRASRTKRSRERVRRR